LPDHRIENVVVQGPTGARTEDDVRRELLEGIKRIPLAPGDAITHLVIETHGDTVDENGKTMSVLAEIGRFGAEGVTPEFEEIFSPLKGRLEPNANVVLNSCSTMCGPRDDAARRSQALLRYFGVTNGSLYGAVVSEMQIANGYKDHFNWREWITLRKTLVLSLPLAGAVASAAGLVAGDGSMVGHLAGVSLFALPFADRIGTWLGIVNSGLIFRFRDGKVETVQSVDRLRNRDEIYGVGLSSSPRCERLFASP
jgi:hypothetical protein